MNDLRYAFRQLVKNPGFTAVSLLTIALGIGANTAVFSLVNGIMLKPLAYPQPEQLVALWERDPRRGFEQGLVSGPNFLDWTAQNTVFQSMAVSPSWPGLGDFNLVKPDGVMRVKGSYVSSSYFHTLGIQPLLGRTFLPEEDLFHGNRVAVLSFPMWQSHFGGRSNALGAPLILDTYGLRDYKIVGVMPPGFRGPSETDIWLPLGWMGVNLTERRSAHWHRVIARLKPGITIERARAEMNAVQARLAQTYPEELIGSQVSIVPMRTQVVGRDLERALVLLWAVVAGVLLIACVNVANLLLARVATRRKEIAVRLALGASRWRVFRQLLIESLMLSAGGGALGLLFAWWGIRLFMAITPANIPRLDQVALDTTALVLTFVICVASGVLFGLAPAWQAASPGVNDALKEINSSPGESAQRLRRTFVIAEVALSLVLLVSSGLMLRSFARLVFMDRGFAPEHLLVAELDYSVSGFGTWMRPTSNRPQVSQRAMLEQLRQRPGIISAAVTSKLPRQADSAQNQTIAIEDHPVGPRDEPLTTSFQAVSPDYFRTMGVPLVRGRDFSEVDDLSAPQVAIINQAMARRYFANENPIGQRLALSDRNNPRQPDNSSGQPNGPWRVIVGVVADMKNLSLSGEVLAQTFVPYWQWPMQSPTLVARASANPASLFPIVRAEIKAAAPNLPNPTVRTMEEILAATIAQPRLQTGLLTLFAGLALALAALGLYGVLAYAVAQRKREIGIRLALGAQKRNVLSLVLADGMKLAGLGLMFGLVSSLALTRLLSKLLYGIKPTDPLTFGMVSLVLLIVALLACWLPARRATQIELVEALRYE